MISQSVTNSHRLTQSFLQQLHQFQRPLEKHQRKMILPIYHQNPNRLLNRQRNHHHIIFIIVFNLILLQTLAHWVHALIWEIASETAERRVIEGVVSLLGKFGTADEVHVDIVMVAEEFVENCVQGLWELFVPVFGVFLPCVKDVTDHCLWEVFKTFCHL